MMQNKAARSARIDGRILEEFIRFGKKVCYLDNKLKTKTYEELFEWLIKRRPRNG